MRNKSLYSTALFVIAGIGFTSCMKVHTDGNSSRACSIQQYAAYPLNTKYVAELRGYQSENNLPGAIIAIKKENQPLWIGATGFSNIDDSTQMTTCTPFRIGSITKVFTAVVVMKLKEQGRISLEDNLAMLLPEVVGKIPKADKITVRMLLNHSNGIFDPKNDDPVYLRDMQADPMSIDRMTIDEKLSRYVYAKPLFFDPGTGIHYSNAGYWLLGKIIEGITKRPMQGVMDEVIFRPAKLQNSYYEKRSNPDVCHGYFNVEGKLADVTLYDRADGDGDPSSGIISTAADLYQFGEALFAGRLVSMQSLREMNTTTKFPDCTGGDCGYGLGIERYDVGNFSGYGKNGSSIGFDANWIYFPDSKASIVVFANKGGGTSKSFMERVLQ